MPLPKDATAANGGQIPPSRAKLEADDVVGIDAQDGVVDTLAPVVVDRLRGRSRLIDHVIAEDGRLIRVMGGEVDPEVDQRLLVAAAVPEGVLAAVPTRRGTGYLVNDRQHPQVVGLRPGDVLIEDLVELGAVGVVPVPVHPEAYGVLAKHGAGLRVV